MTAVKNTLSQYTLINNNTAVRSAPIPEETTILRYLCPAALLLNSQVINKTSRFIRKFCSINTSIYNAYIKNTSCLCYYRKIFLYNLAKTGGFNLIIIYLLRQINYLFEFFRKSGILISTGLTLLSGCFGLWIPE